VGAMLGFTAVITALVLPDAGLVWGLLAGLGAGAGAGLINGLLVTKVNMPSFIATLASLSILSGLTLYLTKGNPVGVSSDAFRLIGTGRILGVPVPIWILLFCAIIFGVLLARSRFGRQVYATGDNFEAAHLSGMPVDRVKVAAFVISGVLAGIAGFILAARLGTAQPSAGKGLELTAIAAVIIGGTSLLGGRGAVIGTVIGALLLGTIDNGLNLLNVSPFLQDVVKGAVILFAVFIDRNAGPMRVIVQSFKRVIPGTPSPTKESAPTR
ncbi:MAG TPA: ABC transporter permease, partial [Dermatophilaceae bacterium]|nr:ABC transporter permease [Dermatophilaceae bacterium]